MEYWIALLVVHILELTVSDIRSNTLTMNRSAEWAWEIAPFNVKSGCWIKSINIWAMFRLVLRECRILDFERAKVLGMNSSSVRLTNAVIKLAILYWRSWKTSHENSSSFKRTYWLKDGLGYSHFIFRYVENKATLNNDRLITISVSSKFW